MATQYPGDRSAVQMPASIPNDGVTPIAVVPDDGDDLNVSSVLQSLKVAMDFIDYCTHRFETFPGVRDYEPTRTYTAGMMCLDTDGMTYRVKTGQSSINIHPAANGTKWERWGYSQTEVANGSGDASGLVTTTNGTATISNARMMCFPGSTEKLVACRATITFTQSYEYGVTLILGGAAQFANQIDGCTVQLASTGSNSFDYITTAGDYSSTTRVGVYALGFTTHVNPIVLDVWIRGH